MLKPQDLDLFPLLQGLNKQDLTILARQAQIKHFAAGTMIFEEDHPGGELCLIREGVVRVSRLIREGEHQTLGILEKGMYFGAISLIDGKPHSASVIAVTEVTTIHIQRRDFDRLAEEDPVCALNLLRTITASLCSVLRQMDAKFIDMVQYVSQNK